MSYIIKGILNRQLPWGLVLLGVMIALVLEMSGIPSLAFAVGVYLPLSSSSPIFIGGMVRWLGDLYVRKKYRGANLTEEQLTAEGDKSPGVLMASGYIAGGAIAGILIAFMAGVPFMADFNDAHRQVVAANNPFVSRRARRSAVVHPVRRADRAAVSRRPRSAARAEAAQSLIDSTSRFRKARFGGPFHLRVYPLTDPCKAA